MQTDTNKTFVQHVVQLWQSQQGLDELARLVTTDYAHHAANGATLNWEQFKQSISFMLGAFPDVRFTIKHLLAEDDWVAAYLTFEATHQGAFADIAPTNKQIVMNLVYHCRIANGKIAEDWDIFLALPLFQQLKLVLQAERG